MKKYSVNVHYDVAVLVENVMADNEEEAIEIAKTMSQEKSLNDSDYAEITDASILFIDDKLV